MTPEDSAALARAVQTLEHPGFAARLTNMAGKPIELIGDALPAPARQAIANATSKALQAALSVALRTMQATPLGGSRLVHKVLATASGAAGGAFGLATLPLELPFSTIIMLRSNRRDCPNRGRRSFRPRSGTLMYPGLRIRRTGRVDRCFRKRLFRCEGRAREECN